MHTTPVTPTASPLPQRRLGQQLSVSALGYGAMGMSEFYGPSDDAASMALLHEVVDRGVTLIDTADVYGRGHNERLIGEFLRSRHAEVAAGQLKVATKCGIERPADAAYARRINNEPAYLRRCCEASLQRLGLERIDLFYLHRVDPAADLEATMDCLARLVQQGKIAHVGLCEVSARTLERAHRLHPVAALQSEYSLWSREVEHDILPATRALGIGLVAYSPLGRGFLTGRLNSTQGLAEGDFRRSNPRFEADNLAHNLRLLDSVRAVAARHGATPGQVALAWLLAQGGHIVPIPGTRRLAYLQENLAALSVQLHADDLQQLDRDLAPGQVRGMRYTAEGMKGIHA
ncbi:aldo/keto reductase [Eleftheria terrae]|uniref:aldo/keto reductase n=1 Tax=Eleftheria terrae TaxID=1597781 RepID=UPI00263B0BEC|nr:aldo/keto reductase [Eleftheria terrae]WKB51997.1 aldo/keto reductase [Eleftheria terrae]